MVLSNGLRFSWVCLGRFLVLLQKDLPQMDTDKKGWDTDEISLALDYTRIAREFICDLLSKQKDQPQMYADMIRALSSKNLRPHDIPESQKSFSSAYICGQFFFAVESSVAKTATAAEFPTLIAVQMETVGLERSGISPTG